MGPIQENLITQAYRFGEPLSERVQNAPELNLGLEFYFTAFFELDNERSHAMGYTQIPRSAILSYANECGLDDEARYDLIHCVRKMDLANIKFLNTKNPINKSSENRGNGNAT